MNIEEALLSLDPANDEHWTSDGAPRVDVVGQMVGAPVARAQIIEAAPSFSRQFALEEAAKKRAAEAPAADQEKPAEADASGLGPEERRHLEIDERLAELHAASKEIDEEVAQLQAEQARLARFAPHPGGYNAQSDQDARMAYIHRSNKARAGRGDNLEQRLTSMVTGAIRKVQRPVAPPQQPIRQ